MSEIESRPVNNAIAGKKRNPYTVWFVVIAFVAPVVLAYVMFFFVEVKSFVNHGEIFMCFEEETIKNTDFCLVKQRTHPGNSSNMIVLRNKNNFKKYLLDAESTYQECAFKFISMEIVIDNKRLHVPLFLQDNYNYFMVDNELDKDFMLYFIKTHLLSEYQDIFGDTSFHNIINGEFQFDIIDHNCESKCIDGQATIKFFKEAYEIE